MKKRIIPALIAVSLLASGCSAIVDGEYAYIYPHSPVSAPDSIADGSTVEVSGREELDEALMSLVRNHAEYGRIRFTSYDGDAEADLAAACVYVTNVDPLGSYGVYYVNYSLDLIVSYYEADVSIIYKRTADEIASVGNLSVDGFSDAVSDALSERAVSFAFYLDGGELGQAELDRELDRLYYSEPSMLYRPEGKITSYPADGERRICEVVFTYPYSQQETASRLSDVDLTVDGILEGAEELEGDELIREIALRLAEYTEYDAERELTGEYSPWAQVYTVYGALIHKRAAGEGFAMAMKHLLAKAGLDCLVVRGELDGVSHSWNIVFLEDGGARHLDVSLIDAESGEVPLYTDREMDERYAWEGDYPPCVREGEGEEEQSGDEPIIEPSKPDGGEEPSGGDAEPLSGGEPDEGDIPYPPDDREENPGEDGDADEPPDEEQDGSGEEQPSEDDTEEPSDEEAEPADPPDGEGGE